MFWTLCVSLRSWEKMIRFPNIILAVCLFLIPAKSFAGGMPFPWDLSVGGGSNMFAVGVDWSFLDNRSLNHIPRYCISPGNEMILTVRTRYIYDFNEHQSGFFLQPNLKYLHQIILFDLTVGPEIGWFSENGFDYGASARLGITPFIYFEVGHFFNSKRTYFNILGNVPIGLIFWFFVG